MSPAAINWCCDTFRHRYEAAGESTIAVLVVRGFEDQPAFFLQARAIDITDSAVPLDMPVTLTLVSEFVVHFCPWCGVPLRKWYRKTAESLIRPGLGIPIE